MKPESETLDFLECNFDFFSPSILDYDEVIEVDPPHMMEPVPRLPQLSSTMSGASSSSSPKKPPPASKMRTVKTKPESSSSNTENVVVDDAPVIEDPEMLASIEDMIAYDAVRMIQGVTSSSFGEEGLTDDNIGVINLNSQLGISANYHTYMNMLTQISMDNKSKLNTQTSSVSAGIYAPRSSSQSSSIKRSAYDTSVSSDTSNSKDDKSRVIAWEPFFPIARVLNFITVHDEFYKTQLPSNAHDLMQSGAAPECISAAHVKNVLCERFHPFRACIWGKNCKAYLDHSKFVAMEYVTPQQYEQGVTHGNVSSTVHQMCIICWMYVIYYIYVMNVQRGQTAAQIQVPFYFKMDEPNEYRESAMIQGQSPWKVAGSENTYGLVVPFRCYSKNQFSLDQMSVKVGESRIRVKCLREFDSLFFTEHPANGPQVVRVDPIKYARPVITNLPTTDMILTHRFNLSNTEHVIGVVRLSNFGNMNGIPEKKIPLYQYWCMTESGTESLKVNEVYDFEPFLWRLVFCKNIGVLANNLPQFIRSGRIDLDWLWTHTDLSRCIVDFTKPLTYYEYKLKDSEYEDRMLYLSLCLRIIVIRTLLKVYPNSKNSKHDSSVHQHLRNFLRWHEDVHCKSITCDTNDSDPDIPFKLKEFVDSEIPFHMYASDTSIFLKYRTELRSKEGPSAASARYYPEHAWCFMEFGSMQKCIRNRTCSDLESFEFNEISCRHLIIPPQLMHLYENKHEDIYTKYSILTCLLIRVNMSMEIHHGTLADVKSLYSRYKSANKNPAMWTRDEFLDVKNQLKALREKRYQVRLFAYTHLQLALRMYDLCVFDDDALNNDGVDRGNPNHRVNHITEVYPYDCVTIHEGMLPDFSTSIIGVPFMGGHDDSRAAQKYKDETFKVMSEFLPRPNTSRNVWGCKIDKHIQWCMKHAPYMNITLSIMEVMMLGAYRHADHLMPFMKMLSVYKNFNTHYSPATFKTWQEERTGLVSAAMREFLCWTIERATPYDDFITQNHSYWLEYRRRLYESTDIIRMTYDRSKDIETYNSGCILLVSNITMALKADKELSDSLLKWLGYTKGDVVPDVVNEHATNIVPDKPMVRRVYLDPVRELCKHLHNFNARQEKKGHTRLPKFPVEVFKCIYAKVKSIKPQTPIDLFWLYEFNLVEDNPLIKLNTVRALEHVMVCIMQGKTATDKIEGFFLKIPPMEFEIVDAFFNLLLIHYSITVYTLPQDVHERQINALKKRFEIDEIERPGAEQSEYAFCAMYADCCTTLRSFTAQLHGDSAYGGKLLGFDPFSNKIVCKAQTVKGAQRKTVRATKLKWANLCNAVRTENTVDLKRAMVRMKPTFSKSQTRFYMQPECGSVPMTVIFMPGKVLQITDPRISMNDKPPNVNAYAICCVCGSLSNFAISMYGANSFECTVCEAAQVKDRYTPTCVACDQKIKPSLVPHSFIVFNDRVDTGDMVIRNEYICQRCYNCKTANWHPNHIYTVSDIKNSKKARMSGMEWICWARNGRNLGKEEFTTNHSNGKRLLRRRHPKKQN